MAIQATGGAVSGRVIFITNQFPSNNGSTPTLITDLTDPQKNIFLVSLDIMASQNFRVVKNNSLYQLFYTGGLPPSNVTINLSITYQNSGGFDYETFDFRVIVQLT